MGWTFWIGLLLLIAGILLPLAWAYFAELENKEQPLRWRGGGLSVEFIVGDARSIKTGKMRGIETKIELFVEDMTNVVAFQAGGDESYTLLLRNLISYFRSKLKA